jgi:hypothetical protein
MLVQEMPYYKNEDRKSIKVRVRYTDGHYEIRCFDVEHKKDIDWIMHMEGDHMHSWEYLT